MTILAFSDLHRDTDAARAIVAESAEADVVVGAGDFGTEGHGAAETLEVLKACAVPVVIVHGNHDDPQALKEFCAGWPNGHYLHGGAVTLAGMTFFGLGGEIPPRTAAPWNAAETEADAARMLARCPRGAVLVTHTPPLGCADVQAGGAHEGSAAVEDAIRFARPVLGLCGHIHHAWGTEGCIDKTSVFNLGPAPAWFELRPPRR